MPHFSHELIDQSGLRPEEVQGELKEQLMQLLLMAAYHPALAWMPQVARLLGVLSSLEPRGGVNYVRLFMLYILETQEPESSQSFRGVLRQQAPALGDELMTYAQELRTEGKARNQVEVIQGFLREGVAWSVIERATGVSEAQFQTLKQQVEEMNE